MENHLDWLTDINAIQIRLDQGCQMEVDLADYDGRKTFFAGWSHNDPMTSLFHYVLRPGNVVLDIGANQGYFSLLGSKLVKSRGCVHAFEANPQMVARLQHNMQLSNVDNVVVHNLAVSDRIGEVEFSFASSDHTGLSSMRDLGQEASHRRAVSAITIDSIGDNFPTIDLVKIDVEGAEHQVLCGMKEMIAKNNPVITLELTDPFLRQMDTSAESLLKFLDDLGYVTFQMVGRQLSPLPDLLPDQLDIASFHPSREMPEELAAGLVEMATT